eukprot:CAMPEP_0185750034 /NCGR_PEP_ID=MMETSP1174-20130828/8747_1 /TAXON_ID=35687 /ORGANISM="Dictyocha speculum, Strain CCMP1381" /LENGTH=551 /DNA_ID=CAMNT_0028426403 /DNA_START=346 /DNA_END=2001 /DNA_ORIENTATION=-
MNKSQGALPRENLDPFGTSAQRPVVIVGGGIGGCALALALRQRHIPAVLFEKDATFDCRAQGYGLTMQQGAKVLKQLGFRGSFHDFGVSSHQHHSYSPDGGVVGAYGRSLHATTRATGGNGKGDDQRFNFHIPRQALRKMLLDELTPESIRWGHRFIGYGTDQSSGCVTVRFEESTLAAAAGQDGGGDPSCGAHINEVVVQAALVVGADGIWSSVRGRKLLDLGASQAYPINKEGEGEIYNHATRKEDDVIGNEARRDQKPEERLRELGGEREKTDGIIGGTNGNDAVAKGGKGRDDALRYLGVIVILGRAPCSHPLTQERVFQTLDGETRIFTMPFTAQGDNGEKQGVTMWQLSFRLTESDAKTLGKKGGEALLREAMARCDKWHEPIPQLLRMTPPEDVTGYPAYDRVLPTPTLCREGTAIDCTANTRVTLIGDAIHPMSPFKGQGANQALVDAVSLAREIFPLWHPRPRRGDDVNADTPGVKTEEAADAVPPTWAQSGLLSEALGRFEGAMLDRVAAKVEGSARAAELLHCSDALKKGNITRAAAARD